MADKPKKTAETLNDDALDGATGGAPVTSQDSTFARLIPNETFPTAGPTVEVSHSVLPGAAPTATYEVSVTGASDADTLTGNPLAGKGDS